MLYVNDKNIIDHSSGKGPGIVLESVSWAQKKFMFGYTLYNV